MAQHLIMSGIPAITTLSLNTDPEQQLDHENSFHGLIQQNSLASPY